MKSFLAGVVRILSPGVSLVLALGLASVLLIAFLPAQSPDGDGLQVWVFDANQAKLYRTLAPEWDRRHPTLPLRISQVVGPALQSRMLSGFYSGTPVADLIEIDRIQVAPVFAGPLQDVGFVDLTERLEKEGLMARVNRASFSPWTSRGHIFGLPHDVHPVMLVYRADLVEAAGIEVNRIETWDDYFRVMRPLRSASDSDGYIDRYPLALSLNNPFFSEIFLLQGGGGYFDGAGAPTLNSPVNARLLARLALWYGGPGREIGNFDMFSGAGLQLISNGYTLAILAPDWYAGSIVTSLPHLAGKLKVMPMPAWEHGGRRTSVNGGTMLGITKASRHPQEAWELAKYLYFSPVVAERLFATTHIVSPMIPNWTLACYDAPDPYFSRQPVGRLYLRQAPQVPLRPSSPYIGTAILMVNNALTRLIQIVESRHFTAPAQIEPEARQMLDQAQGLLLAEMHRNVFLNCPTP